MYYVLLGSLKRIIGVYFFYNIVLISTLQQSESPICMYVCVYMYIYTYPLFFGLPSHLGHHRTLSRVP